MTLVGPGGEAVGASRSRERSTATAITIEVVVRDDRATVTVTGELDVEAIGRFRSVVGALLDLPEVRHLDVDGGRLSFVDSSGLRALLLSRADAQLAGVPWRLVGASAALQRVLELSGVGLRVDGRPPGERAGR